MKKWMWLGLVLALIFGLSKGLTPSKSLFEEKGYDMVSFSALPVIHEGRIKPLDTLARVSLMSIRGKQSLKVETEQGGKQYTATDWLLTAMTDPRTANRLAMFNLRDPSQYGLSQLALEKKKIVSFTDLIPYFDHIQEQAAIAFEIEHEQRSHYQRNIVQLHNQLMTFFMLKNTFSSEPIQDPIGWITRFEQTKNRHQGQLLTYLSNPDSISPKVMPEVHELVLSFREFQLMSQNAIGLVIPAAEPENWQTMGASLLTLFDTDATLNPVAKEYLTAISAVQAGSPDMFNQSVQSILSHVDALSPGLVKSLKFEVWFHKASLFYTTLVAYLMAAILMLTAWLLKSPKLHVFTTGILGGTVMVHTLGLVIRMVLQGRPPVTNLYSTAVFIGWFAILLGLLFERHFKNGVGNFVSGIIGFLTLIVAHHLSLTGDTLEMMQAVLDSNFWLATHVVVINIGYGAAILSAVLAHIYILGGVFTKSITPDFQSSLVKMTFTTVAFGLVANFVGTVLGGIWADQSWGRFWGWDPKENGALLIVIWLAIILHARIAGLIKARGVMILSVFTNVVTSFSWFGTNMLGIGLHSYGFMEEAFFWLVVFCATQLTVMAIGCLPPRFWKTPPGAQIPN